MSQLMPSKIAASPLRRAEFLMRTRGVAVPKTFPRRATYSLSIFILCDVSPEFPRGFASIQIPAQFEGRNLPLHSLRSVVDCQMESIGMDRATILSVRCLLLNSDGKVRFDGFAYRSTPDDSYVAVELVA